MGMLRTLVGRMFGPVVLVRHLDATPARVYAVLSHPSTYPKWLVGVDHMRSVDAEFPEPGSGFDHSLGPVEPVTVDDRTESIVAEEDRHLALDVRAWVFRARVDFALRPQAGGTRLSFSEQPVGPTAMFTPVMRPMLYLRNVRSLNRLGKQLA